MAIDHDVRAGADWAVEVLTAAGYRADFSPSSLWEIERFLNAEAPDGRPRSRGLLGKDLDVRVAMLGGYVGEVIRRRVGGTWVRDGDHAALDLPGGARIWPAQQVMHRLATGAGGSLTAYASAAGADPGPSTPVLQCRCCGAVPAADTKFRAVQSVLIWIGYTRAPGPFCRDCGTAVFRDLQQKMFTFGWYGIFAVAAPIVLLLNWAAMTKVTALAAPAAQPGGAPVRPMDAGRPLLRRPQVIAGILAPIVLLTAFAIHARSTGP
ncbi:hypothetical protein ACQEVZ_00185 [Dactylosporangium sp. CA-152071]|uniref:hypothetical protein n=1 Tax=Dactylosporangium sp. CA-152071 TaxID=3239933 RepID=UPI003D8AAA6D